MHVKVHLNAQICKYTQINDSENPLEKLETSSVTNIACPMCRDPVTLGGGIDITKGSVPRSKFGLKYP